ncbi:4220_t:CDS:1, partial [Acaulospora morrowiae]
MIYVRFQAIGRHFLGIRNNGTYNIFPQLRTTSFLSARRSDYTNASSDVKPLQHHSTQLDFPFISTFNKNKEANKNLRLIFDDPDVWTNFISRSHKIAPLERDTLSSKEKLTGLFRNPELATPQGFRTAAEKVLRRAKLLVHRITNAKTDDELRKVVKNLDRLSDMLCSVIDTAEFVRATHPDPKFSQSANWAYEHLYSYMNFLNTNRDLWK